MVKSYLKSFKYYNNDQCISLNISCDEDISEMFIEDFGNGYPVLHIPFDMEYYDKISGDERNKFWLNVIYDSIKHAGDVWNWDLEFFDNVYKGCIIRLGDEI